MNKPILRNSLPILLALLSCACQSMGTRIEAPSGAATGPRQWFDGEYDNHEQVALAAQASVPRARIVVTPLQKPGWYAWNVELRGQPDVSATWVMRSVKAINGNVVITPFRAIVATPAKGKDFDLGQWVALDACALEGVATPAGLQVKTDVATCTTLVPGIGANAALLPLEIEHDGEWLRVRLYTDQARGPDARIEARRLRWFAGWAALNGAGPNAKAESGDWHMNRAIRIDNEGGRAPLAWRDGRSSGYSLELSRMTYRDGNVPVLKLSIIDDASGRSVVYAWADPQATRIGINLGWVQVGLEASGEQGR